MKILWLSHLIPYPPKGGVLQRSHHLVKETARYHDVDLLAFNQVDLISPLFDSVEQGVEEAYNELSSYCNLVEFYDIPSDQHKLGTYWLALKSLVTKDPYNINWLKSKAYRKAIKKHLAATNYDLVHIDCISFAPYIDMLGDIPIVMDHHNIESHMLLRRADKEDNRLKSVYFRQEGKRLQKVEEKYCPKMALNITCSEMDSERLRKFSPRSKTLDIPNGVDESHFKSSSQPETGRLLFIGTLSWYPNTEAVMFIAEKIWPLLKNDEHISFDIVGANPPEKLIELTKNEDSFQVHGFVDDVRKYFDAAEIFICPITDGGGTKLKILDALAMGKAIIAHPIACEGIDVEDGKSVVFAETPEEYAEKIRAVLSDNDLKEALRINGRKLIEQEYTYTAIGKKLSQAYIDCTQTHSDK